MNIAVIAKTRLPIAEPFRGGLEAFTHGICLEYQRAGHEVTLYAHADSDEGLNVVSFYGSEHRSGVDFEAYEADEYMSILRDIESKSFDIIHNNSTHELPIIWGTRASVPIVTTLHAPPLFSKIKPAITASQTSTNLHFVSISDSLAASWKPYLGRPAHVIHNGIDATMWPLTRRSSDYLLWYGRMVPTKGLDIALEVAHLLDMPLHFAGSLDDQEYYDSRIKPRISAVDVYLGHLNQGEILRAMRGAAAMINPARWEEPFGLTNIEAMAAGVPVAGFDRGAFREIISDASGRVAYDTTVAALAAATSSAMRLPSTAVSEAAQRFDSKRMAENYIRYFEAIT